MASVSYFDVAAAKALEWVVEHLEYFDPFSDDRPFQGKRVKRFLELAIMTRTYVIATGECNNDYVRRIIHFLHLVQSKREFMGHVLRYPRHFVAYCNIYRILRLLGEDNLDQRLLIQKAIDAGLPTHVERTPHRMMELSLSLERGGFHHNLPSMEALTSPSILSRKVSALYLDEPAIYELTHVILFLYDFGAESEPLVSSHSVMSASELRQLLSTLLIVTCQKRHWDLVGELLLCWECMALERTMLYDRAWQAFLKARNSDGSFLGPEKLTTSAHTKGKQFDLEQERETNFSNHYHTTLVGIMALSKNTRTPADDVPSRPYLGIAAANTDADSSQDNSRYPDAHTAFCKARKWLEQLLGEVEQGGSNSQLDVLCKILLGCWICDSVVGTATSAFPVLARRIDRSLRTHYARVETATFDAPSTAVIIAGALLARKGLAPPPLHAFLLETAKVLNRYRKRHIAIDTSLSDKHVLLNLLGKCPEPELVNPSEIVTFARGLPLTAPKGDIENLLLHINCATLYGTRQVCLHSSELWLQEMLAGLSTHDLQQYDILLGCKLLRAMCYLGLNAGQPFTECTRYLFMHQRPEGAFGFLGPEESHLVSRMPKGFSADTDLYLPITLECLWTLAEITSKNWRLYESVASVP